MDAELYGPDVGWVGASELVLRRLLPIADEGLTALGLSEKVRAHYLGVIEGRCVTRKTGASWQRAQVVRHEDAGLSRPEALVAMLGRYVENMRGGNPVHTWPV